MPISLSYPTTTTPVRPSRTPRRQHRFLRRLLNWENWPWPFFQFPMGFVWIGYCIRSRSPWFFTASNPTLEFGGFEGEGKKEMYVQLPPGAYPKTVFLQARIQETDVTETVQSNGFRFPVAVKPEIGMKGLLFRKIENMDQLLAYHRRCPVEYMIQEWVDLPIELSVFYARHPNAQQGEITGMTWKELIEVQGDGKSTLEMLINACPRAATRLQEFKHRHAAHLSRVIPVGETFPLIIAANRQQGARLHNLQHEVDDALTLVFDQISLYHGHLYWGRFDLKCNSIDDLRQGKNFQILEFNGAGAAPNHIYHAGLSFGAAWAEVQKNWQKLYEISRFNHQKGTRYWSFWRGLLYLKVARRHFKMLEQFEHEL